MFFLTLHLKMWYEDLAECDYFANMFPIKPTAVGWLENGKPFTKGETSGKVVERLIEFRKIPLIKSVFCGYHTCDFCGFVNIELGATTFYILYQNKIYVFPGLIVHYIEEHGYRPPDEFIEAVLSFDHKSTMEYFDKIRENQLRKNK